MGWWAHCGQRDRCYSRGGIGDWGEGAIVRCTRFLLQRRSANAIAPMQPVELAQFQERLVKTIARWDSQQLTPRCWQRH